MLFHLLFHHCGRKQIPKTLENKPKFVTVGFCFSKKNKQKKTPAFTCVKNVHTVDFSNGFNTSQYLNTKFLCPC